MSYSIQIRRRAQKELASLPRDIFSLLRDRIRQLANQPRPYGSVRLKDRPGWRLKTGDFRIIYNIDDSKREVVIVQVGHRRDVYR